MQNEYEVCSLANSGKKAIQIEKEENPDIVLMDIILKDEMRGIETAEEIFLTLNIPSILMSGYTGEYIKKLLIGHADFKYLMKPIKFPNLIFMIKSVLNKDKNI